MLYSYDVVFDESFFSLKSYTSQIHSEETDMQPAVSRIPYAKSSREKTCDIITFYSLKRRIYDLKLVKIRKVVTNTMTIKLCSHYLAKNEWM